MSPPRSPAPEIPAPDADGEPAKRRAIVHAAVRVFAAKGYHGSRIADIAREAGVAYGLVYHYFQNKEALLQSVLDEQWTLLIGALRGISDDGRSAPEQLAAMCRFALDVYRTAPAAVRVLLLEMARTPAGMGARAVRSTFEQAVEIIAGVVERGVARGELRADIEPRVAAAGFLGALELTLTGIVLGVIGVDERHAERVAESVVQLVLAGLTPRPGAAP